MQGKGFGREPTQSGPPVREPTMSDGRLRVYLGPAPGVGKTFAALTEVRELREAGVDAVVGTVDTHGRRDVAALVEGLEVISPRMVDGDGESRGELSVEGVIARRPDVVLVDDLAHTNPSGSPRAKRWQDVRLLLEAGIDVITTLNVQHLESLQDVVRDITGMAQADTIPDEVVRAAEEIELVDLTQEGIRERLAAGRIYPPEEIDAALANFFRPGNLGALRELALFWTADRVDELVERYRLDHGIEEPWETRERVVVGVTGAAGGEDTIRRAGRMAMRSRGELVGMFVRTSDARPGEDAELDGQRELIKRLGGTYHEISGSDVGEALVEFARANNATQLVIGATRRSRWHELVRGSVVADILRRAGDLDVHVISGPAAVVRRHHSESRSPLPRRRRAWGWVAALAGFGLATSAMLQTRGDIPLQNVLLVYLVLSVVVAWIGGLRPALTSAVAGFLLGNYLFTPPYRTWSIASGEDVFALGVFVVVAGLVGLLVGSAARRAAEAASRAAEAETLIGMIGAGRDGSAQRLIEALQLAIDSGGMALFGSDGRIVASTGESPPDSVDGADRVVEVRDCRLAISSGHLHGVDERLIAATAAQLEAVLDRADLAEEAAEAAALTRTDELRTALLRAVSHDLRSPLSAITASITSLLDPDIEWPSSARQAFLETIDGESRRLGGSCPISWMRAVSRRERSRSGRGRRV